jgi:putative transposase
MTKSLFRPPHLFIDETWYFLTAHTYHDRPVLKPIEAKVNFWETLLSLTKEFKIKLTAWVILDNHYHLLCYLKTAKKLPVFINRLHGVSSFTLNRKESGIKRKTWLNYWDRVIRDEKDYWTKFNYIHYNLVKHGYVSLPKDWAFSSYEKYVKDKGMAWINDCWESYPVVSFDFE